jgi:hypothetical protein
MACFFYKDTLFGQPAQVPAFAGRANQCAKQTRRAEKVYGSESEITPRKPSLPERPRKIFEKKSVLVYGISALAATM